MKIIFCTQNKHKVQEVARIANKHLEFIPMNEAGFTQDIPEPFDTLEENARTKAETVYNFCLTPCFSEDSGLFVEALHGKPGVRSARYAGPQAQSSDNIELLLGRLEDQSNRKAYFKTVIAFCYEGKTIYFSGECHGHIIDTPHGVDGFGYDPIFIPDGDTRTFAEMSLDEKNQYSHRRKAVDAFLEYLNANFN
ncbi:MAG: RdgB/HAM1 family non-canonical purine NTP pyrophosphatase [Chitinophagaceae bacterium]